MKRLALLPALAVATACFQYDDGSTDETPDTTVVPDATADAAPGDDADATVEDDTSVGEDATPAEWGRDLPPYEPAACADQAVMRDTWQPPACDYQVPLQLGLSDARMSCGTSSEAPRGLRMTFPTTDAGTAVAMLWSTTNTTRESVVQIGESEDVLDRTYFGATFTYGGLGDRVIHEVHVCGLLPGRTYYYRAGGEGAWSDVHAFSTAPDPSEEDWEVVFGVTGDSRSDDFELWGQAVRAMRERGAEFIVFSGDAVEAGPVQSQWDRFFDQGQPGMAEMPFIPANGNHDLFVAQYFGQLALPNDEINFPVRYGDLFIASMTDFFPAAQIRVEGEFRDYMDRIFTENTDATWKFLLNHRPFYSASTRHGSSVDIQGAWLPIIDKHEVDLVFNGHDHNYERSKPIRAGEVAAGGTIYTVIAGVGAPLYDNGQQWWTEISEKVPSYAIVRVTASRIDFTAYRLDGTTLDQMTLDR